MNKLFLIPVMALMSLHGSILNLNAQDMKEANVPQNLSAFPIGEPNSQYARFFIGQSYLAPLTRLSELNCPVSNVTFEPACRNNWHRHTGGQLLIAVGGKGFYQARGEKARLLLPGDVVEIPADVEHWHGAAPDSWFSHLAVTCNPQTNENTWLEPVNDAEYEEATREYCQSAGNVQGKHAETNRIRLTVNGGRTFTATLENNSSAQALKELLAKGDMTIEMNDYGDMEKVGTLGVSLPRNDRRTTTEAGDIVLYLGNHLVIYYDTNSWSLTRIGKVDGVGTRKEMLELLGGAGKISVTLSPEP